jgi:hypothetical protein
MVRLPQVPNVARQRRPGLWVRSALAVGRRLREMLLELIRGQLALVVAGEDGLEAQVGAHDDSPIRTKLLDQVVAR